MGYERIKIYNGGIKDWKKNGFALSAIQPLPEVTPQFWSADQLFARINLEDPRRCLAEDGRQALLILDFRNENSLSPDAPPPRIQTRCNTMQLQLDDLRHAVVRRRIPNRGTVVTVTETGNRDVFVMRYLSAFGYSNIKGLRYGMRGWLKQGYPIETQGADY